MAVDCGEEFGESFKRRGYILLATRFAVQVLSDVGSSSGEHNRKTRATQYGMWVQSNFIMFLKCKICLRKSRKGWKGFAGKNVWITFL